MKYPKRGRLTVLISLLLGMLSPIRGQSNQIIWENILPATNRAVILYALEFGTEYGYPELGGHVWAESNGDMDSERLEYTEAQRATGDTLHVSCGAAQVDVYWATKRDHGANFTIEQWQAMRIRLKTDLDFNLEHALKQVQWCQGEYLFRWSWYACYNAGLEYINGEVYACTVEDYSNYLRRMQ